MAAASGTGLFLGQEAVAVGVEALEALRRAGDELLLGDLAVAIGVGLDEHAALAAALAVGGTQLLGGDLAVAVGVDGVEVLGEARQRRGFRAADEAVAVGVGGAQALHPAALAIVGALMGEHGGGRDGRDH